IAEVRAATPRSTGSPALRRALCRRATPTTPVSDPAVMGRLLRRDPTAFPVRMAGRRSQRPFRGLLGLHSHCGPSTRRPTPGGPLFRELQRFGCPPRRLGSYRDVPTTSRTGLSPARDTAPQRGAHSNPRLSRDHVFAHSDGRFGLVSSNKIDGTKTATRCVVKLGNPGWLRGPELTPPPYWCTLLSGGASACNPGRVPRVPAGGLHGRESRHDDRRRPSFVGRWADYAM